jgi:hypothetical protein
MLFFLTGVTFADETIIARCENPKGMVYYPYVGLMTKGYSGWKDDAITGGIIEFIVKDKDLDILFIDATKEIHSVNAQGGKIILLSQQDNQISIMAYYPQQAVEIYTLFTDKDGKNKFILTSVKHGLLTKSSMMVGTCDFINFDQLMKTLSE